MFDVIKAIILGIVEGLTEFLPISSTGHLIILNRWFYFDEDFTRIFDVVIQLGAILSVLVFFWKKLIPFGKSKTSEEKNAVLNLWSKVCVATVPAFAIGALLHSVIEEYLFNSFVVAIMLVVGGFFLIFCREHQGESKIATTADINYRLAVLIGCIQCLGMIPGTSRSAATIIGAVLLGCSRLAAAEFSFFLAIPTMVGASAFSLLKAGFVLSGSQMLTLLVGFLISFIVAFLVIALFMNYISKHDFKIFGYYRIVLGLFVLMSFLF